jgi:carbohydrate-binding DOMON domain-containing protein
MPTTPAKKEAADAFAKAYKLAKLEEGGRLHKLAISWNRKKEEHYTKATAPAREQQRYDTYADYYSQLMQVTDTWESFGQYLAYAIGAQLAGLISGGSSAVSELLKDKEAGKTDQLFGKKDTCAIHVKDGIPEITIKKNGKSLTGPEHQKLKDDAVQLFYDYAEYHGYKVDNPDKTIRNQRNEIITGAEVGKLVNSDPTAKVDNRDFIDYLAYQRGERNEPAKLNP